MAVAGTVLLTELTVEQKAKILDGIILGAEHEGEFVDKVDRISLDANRTSVTWRRSYLPEIDKTSDKFKNGLTEGVTPDAEKYSVAEYSANVIENGWYFDFSTKVLRHSFDDLKSGWTKQLKNLFVSYEDEKIADAYVSTKNVVTDCDLTSLADLTVLSGILYENKAKPIDGFYNLVVSVDLANAMLIAYKDSIQHTSEKEAIIKGEIGYIGNFRVIRSRLQAFKGVGITARPFVAYGLTPEDKYPVCAVSYEDAGNGEIIFKVGDGTDPLNQRGSLGLYVDGQGWYIQDDTCIITGTAAATKEVKKSVIASPSNFVKKETSPAA